MSFWRLYMPKWCHNIR